ncbi:N-acetylmuramoyl-L-alanine amidase [Companilactobacillus suantsaicola]|uniref:N-acetylmuramoyl-L-alanine amidase n=1 Tax=Companilactobacillus suantsaicola TaxID=2487723 RepID=A0A4Z0JG60_9LACO|nr:peptidoglycan recognition family protein [Companilactobacillus suantsaicola]TGD20924.1 N-acetylmuramoyl-L-alanine amidase [Companilactobacillus suantsaicola]
MAQFNIDTQYALGANEGSNQKTNNMFIILHETTNDGAANNAHYFKNNWSTSQTYVQYVIGDGGKIYQVGADGYVAWGAGTYANENSPVQIELARTSDKVTFEKDYATFVNFARYKAQQFGIPCTLDVGGKYDKGIKTHKWVSDNIWGNHIDPVESYLKPFWHIDEGQLAKDIANGVGGSTSGGSTTQTKPARNVVTVKNGPSTGIAGWNGKGQIVPGSNSTFKNGTAWQSAGVYLINGLPMYKVGGDEYIPKKYTDQAGIITINSIHGVNAFDGNGNKIAGTESTFMDYSQWKSPDTGVKVINDKVFFLVATNEYVDGFYTIGGGNK